MGLAPAKAGEGAENDPTLDDLQEARRITRDPGTEAHRSTATEATLKIMTGGEKGNEVSNSKAAHENRRIPCLSISSV